ncbi:MAG: hypothetical protein AAF558_08110 [Verrucomicrobiota bacterium]
MRISEHWSELDEALHHEILETSYLHDKALYRRLNQEMAKGLRKRPKQLLELPRKERHQGYQPLLAMPIYAILTQNLCINWLGKNRTSLLVDFLDALGISHDGNGCAEQFPGEVKDSALKKAMTSVVKKHGENAAIFYLRIFPDISGIDWDSYDKVLEEVTSHA